MMGLVSRNVTIAVAVLVALLAVSALPTNKDGDGKGKGKEKGRRSVSEEGAEGGVVSSLEESFADALAEDAEAALVLEEGEGRQRRAAEEEAESPEGAALVQDEAGHSEFMSKKPCGKRRGGTNSTGTGTDTETTDGETEDMQRQKQRTNKKKKGTAALANWMLDEEPEALW